MSHNLYVFQNLVSFFLDDNFSTFIVFVFVFKIMNELKSRDASCAASVVAAMKKVRFYRFIVWYFCDLSICFFVEIAIDTCCRMF